MNNPERECMLAKALGVLKAALPEAWAVYLLGSFSRGEERPDSDLDLAVLLPPRAIIPDKLELIAQLAREIGRDVDLVDLRTANLDLIHEVLKSGRQLDVTRHAETLIWEAERMTDYADFNPRRADIVAQFMREPL